MSLQILTYLRIPKSACIKITASVLTLFFFILSGFVTQLTGGSKPVLALSNSGPYYDAYYTHQDEVASTTWIDTQIPKGSRIYTDEFARRKLIAYAGVYAQPTLIPYLIPIDSYAYVSHSDEITQDVPVYAGSNLVYYKLPIEFLSSTKNLVYNSGNVKIYR